jgi:hypothetical protein
MGIPALQFYKNCMRGVSAATRMQAVLMPVVVSQLCKSTLLVRLVY